MFENFLQKIWWVTEKCVALHPLSKTMVCSLREMVTKKGNEKIIVKILDFSLEVSIICCTFVTAFPLFWGREFYE